MYSDNFKINLFAQNIVFETCASIWKVFIRGVLGVVRKSRGSPVFVFYCIFKTKFLEILKGVHEVPPSPHPCGSETCFSRTLFSEEIPSWVCIVDSSICSRTGKCQPIVGWLDRKSSRRGNGRTKAIHFDLKRPENEVPLISKNYSREKWKFSTFLFLYNPWSQKIFGTQTFSCLTDNLT